jgi:sensor histidine kinase YesM
MIAKKSKFVKYQVIAWIVAYVLFALYLYQRLEEFPYAVAIATCAFLFFIIIIYGYALYIYPRFQNRNQPVLFVLAVLVFIGSFSILRTYIEYRFVSRIFSHESFFTAGKAHLAYVFVTNFVALLIGILLKWVSEYFIVKTRQIELEKKQLEMEMRLLKSQLHPHFLFNSLNNIYYEAYQESPRAAQLIEKLSGMMRFFFEVSSRNRIPIGEEIKFINTYIELEQIRCHNPIKVELNDNIDYETPVPPILMIPLVENIIKHGIEKKSKDNFIWIDIHKTNGVICFTAKNRVVPSLPQLGGTGLTNLEERMRLLYGNSYTLHTVADNGVFTAILKIPVK